MNDQDRVRRGWYMYDWANSAFAITILSALFGPFLDKVVVPEGGYDLGFGMEPLSATSLYGYTLGLSALFVLFTAPLLGAIADSSNSKKKFLFICCYLGSSATIGMFFLGPGDVVPALLLFFLANLGFIGGNVFYDSFLPHIATPEEQDVVSGKGFAYGYAGGGLLFLLQLLLVQFHESFGIVETSLAVRIALASAGLWWGGFAIITFRNLHEPRLLQTSLTPARLIQHAFGRLWQTLRKVRSLRHMLLFLVAFMIYNDGIQTVIAMATIYGSEELGFDTLTLMGCLLMIQVIGIGGANGFGRLAQRYGSKNMLLVSLEVWSVVVLYAYLMTQPLEFWILGGIVGLVLGGSQALSRSLYSKIIPPSASAEFFGFFSVFEKFSAIWGPILFAVIRQTTGSSRLSILALGAFFVIGFVLLLFLDMNKAKSESVVLDAQLSS